MTNILIKEQVNIDLYPSLIPIGKDKQLTIGDLHGNALKLLHFLIKHNIVESNEDDYQQFVEIYRKDNNALRRADLDKIKHICETLIIKDKIKICLIGDVLADRGQNDYFTLLLLNKLHKESISVDILLSNHDFIFIESLETNDGIFRSKRKCGNAIFGRSMNQLQDLIDAKLLEKSEILSLVRESYLPYLKLLSYVINDHDEITYFSHASIDEEVIANFTKAMEVFFRPNTAIQLADSIAAINHSFQQNYVAKNLIHSLPRDEDDVKKENPIYFAMWNREYTILKETKRPYKVNKVYGHDSSGPELDGVYCLDNSLGASLDHHTEEYKVLVTHLDAQLILEKAGRKETNFVNNFFSPPTQNIQKITFVPFGKRLGCFEFDKENNAKINVRI